MQVHSSREDAMHPFPHRYQVEAEAGAFGRVILCHEGLEPIESSAPVEFDGPGDAWSPEGLLVAAVADCFILTFRAVTRTNRLTWQSLAVEVTGVLDRVEGVTAFVRFEVLARLEVASGADQALLESALQRAERGCLISNSLKAAVHLHAQIKIASPSQE